MADGVFRSLPVLSKNTNNSGMIPGSNVSSPPLSPEESFKRLLNYGGQVHYGNVAYPISQKVDLGQSPLFQQGVAASTPSSGISPQTQQILDIIRQQQDYAQKQGISQAKALAGRRGITGSSTEQFGVQQAIEAAARSGQEATQQALGQDFQAQQALQQLQAQGLFQGAGQEMTANVANQQLLANLTSDELASIRGLGEADKDRVLQQLLGNQGIAAQREATQKQVDASKRANNPLNALIGGVSSGIASPF